MALLEQTRPDIRVTGRLALLVQGASLGATGCVVWFANLAPRLHRQTLGSIVGQALGFAFLAWAWSAAITFGLYVLMPIAERADTVRSVLRTSAVAVWFAPATILLSQFSPGALAAALVLVVSATRLMYGQWRQMPPEAEEPREAAPYAPGSFAACQLPERRPWREMAPGLAASLAIQSGVVAVLMHWPLAGAAFLAMSAAFLTAFAMASGAAGAGRRQSLPRSILGVAMTLLLAVGLTVGGSPGVLARGAGWIWGLNSRGGGGAAPPDSATAKSKRQPAPGETGLAGGFPGVILWPEVKPVATLIAPLPAGGNGMAATPLPRPFSIPFSGEYWMYRWPYARPPHDSFRERGSPAALAFSTTDHSPLQMEAYHKLETPVDLQCCGKIQVEIWNADRYPGTVTLELLLVDTERSPALSQSLGDARVTSKVDPSREPTVAVRETLEFPVPAAAQAQFDEFRIVFHRARVRLDKSARIAIDRFVLVPRAM